MSQSRQIALVVAALLTVMAVGCSQPTDHSGSCVGGKCDEIPDDQVPDSPCDGVIKDLSGAGHGKVAGRNHDKFAKLVMRTGDDCPTTFQDIMAKLRVVTAEATGPGGECSGENGAGVVTRGISETAQAMGKPTDYRTVTTQVCGDAPGIHLALLNVTPDDPLPRDVEIISFDESAGVFNYYDAKDGGLRFFGDSKDLLTGAGDGEVRKCAACHTGGGLIMKELETPWIHWEGEVKTPGLTELIETHAELLGFDGNGIEFESHVKLGNDAWNRTRLEHLTTTSVKELLRPLFCSIEINLNNGSGRASPVTGGVQGHPSELDSIPTISLLDPQFIRLDPSAFAGLIPIVPADYDALIKQNGQRVAGVPGAIDTIIDYVFVMRSHADGDFVAKLQDAKIIDVDLIKDVLMVDFTRPVFSNDRCDLLSFAPALSGDQLTAQAIRDGFIANLAAKAPVAGTPAAALLANLEDTGDAPAHTSKLNAFLTSCKSLAPKSFLQNALAITSLNRDKARDLPIIEVPATMPDDNQMVDPNARLHPTTCQLVSSFVAP
jgi:hypothetical protein